MIVKYVYLCHGKCCGPYYCDIADFRNFFKHKPNEVLHITVWLHGVISWFWSKRKGWQKL